MNLEVKQFVNELMSSNCYLIIDWSNHSCVVIDPGSERSEREIHFIHSNHLHLDYMILTHEHTDHTWGVNALKVEFPDSKIVCSENCEKYAKKSSKAYFLFYYDKKGYRYELLPADVIIKNDEESMDWNGRNINFVLTPGHSKGSMCIELNGYLFTGDTIMLFPPHLNKRDSNYTDWRKSVLFIQNHYPSNTIILPGHGDAFRLQNLKEFSAEK